ncbi:MAG TPA: polyhydroxyalkanoate synthesis regulator DNA-binding domain-containing protein [Candidatus Dormibacteraeota bacterium]
MSESQRHLIKKYANRKLYDTATSRYITLEGISDLVRDGYDIQVVDRETGRDITPVILSQLVTTEERRTDFDALGVSRQERGQQLLHYVRDALNVPAALVGQEMERRRGDLESIVDVAIERAMSRLAIPSRRDVEKLSRRLDELSDRVDRLNGGHKRAAKSR